MVDSRLVTQVRSGVKYLWQNERPMRVMQAALRFPWERPLRNLWRGRRVGSDYNILGLCSTGHGASLALVSSRYGVRAVNLERLVGRKNALWMAREEAEELRVSEAPIPARIRLCLQGREGRMPPIEVFEDSWERSVKALLRGLPLGPGDIDFVVASESHFGLNRSWLGRNLSYYFPKAVVRTDMEHHAVHRYQAFLGSGFEEAAVMTADASGEGLMRLSGKSIAMTLSEAGGYDFRVFAEHTSPESSPGRIYNCINSFLGFDAGEEGKTMGLSSYGRVESYREMKPWLKLHEDGSFEFPGDDEIRARLRVLGYWPRRQEDAPHRKHEDLARGIQGILDDAMVNAMAALARGTTTKNFCLAGGTALNSVTNERIFRGSRFEAIYVMPNAGDLGHALGCALYAERALAGGGRRDLARGDGLGPAYSDAEVDAAIAAAGLMGERVEDPGGVAAELIAAGKIVGWFQGGSEFGPRSLGFRSILADCRDVGMKDRLNAKVKHREGFRPFAPAVLLERAGEYFDLQGESPFMLRVVDVLEGKHAVIPSATHVDGTARVQTVSANNNAMFYRLLKEFDRLTGVPVVLNTSFNVAGKPIVERPEDAIACYLSTEIDALILHDRVLRKGTA